MGVGQSKANGLHDQRVGLPPRPSILQGERQSANPILMKPKEATTEYDSKPAPEQDFDTPLSVPRFMTEPLPRPEREPAVPKTAIIDEPNGEFYKFRRPYGMSNFDFEYECSLRITKMRLAIRRSIKKLYEDDFRTFIIEGELIGLNAEILSSLSQFAMDGHNIEIVTEPDNEHRGHRVTVLGIF